MRITLAPFAVLLSLPLISATVFSGVAINSYFDLFSGNDQSLTPRNSLPSALQRRDEVIKGWVIKTECINQTTCPGDFYRGVANCLPAIQNDGSYQSINSGSNTFTQQQMDDYKKCTCKKAKDSGDQAKYFNMLKSCGLCEVDLLQKEGQGSYELTQLENQLKDTDMASQGRQLCRGVDVSGEVDGEASESLRQSLCLMAAAMGIVGLGMLFG